MRGEERHGEDIVSQYRTSMASTKVSRLFADLEIMKLKSTRYMVGERLFLM